MSYYFLISKVKVTITYCISVIDLDNKLFTCLKSL